MIHNSLIIQIPNRSFLRDLIIIIIILVILTIMIKYISFMIPRENRVIPLFYWFLLCMKVEGHLYDI